MTREEIIEKLQAYLEGRPEVRFAYLMTVLQGCGT